MPLRYSSKQLYSENNNYTYKILSFRPNSGHLSPSPVHFIRGAYPRARLEAAVLQRFLYNLPESVEKNKHRQDF